ncbi:MAG: hypothetical protein ACNFW9_01035 [Candidatus Kerfeldbacteria bacterium]
MSNNKPIIQSSQYKESFFENIINHPRKYFIIISIILLAIIFGGIFFDANEFTFFIFKYLLNPLLYLTCFITLIYIIYKRIGIGNILKHWAHYYKFDFAHENVKEKIQQRFNENLRKGFFKARSNIEVFFSQKFYINGKYKDRDIKVFSIIGNPSFLSYNIPTMGNKRKFHGYCFEISISKIPTHAFITKNFLGEKDKLDIESNEFEKLYNIDVSRKGLVLQLLDPVILELILDSGVTAIEFSESSIIIYSFKIYDLKYETLDHMLEKGIKIAEQVDRNFPLSKYN